MSPAERVLRLARRRLLESLGLQQGADFRDPLGAAWIELESVLHGQDSSLTTSADSPAPGHGVSSPAQSPHPYRHEYQVLGAPVGCDFQTVRACYRERVKQDHPDQYQANPRAQLRATERLRRLNRAYERLRAYLEGGG
jgi:DnaJ-domain-containing protein 1